MTSGRRAPSDAATSSPESPGIWMSRKTHVRLALGDQLRSLHAVLGFADHFDIGMRPQQLPQPLARRLLVVYE